MSIKGFFARLRPYPDETGAAATGSKDAPVHKDKPLRRRERVKTAAVTEDGKASCVTCELPKVNGALLLIRLAVSLALILLGVLLPMPAGAAFAVFAVSVVCAGYDAAELAVHSVVAERRIGCCLLVTVAAVAAFAIGKAAEGAAVMLIFRLGGFLMKKALSGGRADVSGFLRVHDDSVMIRKNGEMVSIPASEVHRGDIIVVPPGERIPLDGVVLEGISALDVSSLTGETAPVDAVPGTRVMGGSINSSDPLTIRVTADYASSTASKLYRLVREAETRRAPAERLMERIASFYTPIVALCAVAVAILLPLVGKQQIAEGLRRALVLLIAACPCTLLAAVPFAYFSGICGAMRDGILFRGSDALDRTAGSAAVVFGKTGTLTAGDYSVTSVHPRGLDADALLQLAACAESLSEHPMAKGVLAACTEIPDKSVVKRFHEQPGMGVIAELTNGTVIVAGTELLMDKLGITPDKPQRPGSAIHVSAAGRYVGYILLDDSVKLDAINSVGALDRMGVRRKAILTGDKRESAEALAKKLNISEVYAECPPEEKAEHLHRIMDMLPESDGLVFATDGEGDLAALEAADVGILMGGISSDESVAAADAIVMTDEPSKVPEAIQKARSTRRIVRQDVVIALACKVILIMAGISGLAPLWLAALFDAVVSVFLVVYSMRASGSDRLSALLGSLRRNSKKQEN